MEKDRLDAVHYVRKAEKYRAKACATADPRIKSALEAVAREFIRNARGFDAAIPRLAGIQ
jgi:hypothetical protein